MTDNTTPTDEPPDDKIEALEARVAELEAMTEVDRADGGGVSRRKVLGGIATAGGGALLGAGALKTGSEPAAASHGGATLGTQDNPLEAIYVHDLYNTTDSIAADSITTDSLLNSISDSKIQSSFDGLVVPVSVGLGMSDAIDPANSSTPVRDAVDAIHASGSGEGAILLPQGSVDVSAGWATNNPLQNIAVIGWGRRNGTVLNFTDTASSLVSADTGNELQYSRWEGFEIRGANNGRSAPVIHFTSTMQGWDMDSVGFARLTGSDIIHFDTGHAWSSDWDRIFATDYDRFLRADDLGAGLTLGVSLLGSDDSTTAEIELLDDGKFTLKHGWNKGSTACPMVDANGAGSGTTDLMIGRGNWEPSTTATIDYIHRFNFSARVVAGRVHAHGSFTINDSVVQCNNVDSEGGMEIAFGGGVAPYLSITSDVNVPGGVVFGGGSSSCDNQTGGALTGSVHCVADGVFKKTNGTGNDGGTTDIVYGPG